MRRLRWNALESTDCAVCAELRRLRCLRRIEPIALELRWNSAYCLAHSQYYPVAVAAWLRPRFCSRARFLWLTPAVLRLRFNFQSER